MGTSADLWVKCNGKHFVQHTSYDGHPDNVISEIGSTVAACGLDALRQAVDRAVIANDDGDMEQTRDISFQISVGQYFQACQARGKEPFNLLRALRYPYGLPDFAHGGVVGLLGSPIVHDDGFCSSPDEASFVLDLDAGQLFAPVYGDNPAGDPEWMLDLARVEACEPGQVAWALSGVKLDGSSFQERQAAIEACLVLAESGLAQQPAWQCPPPRDSQCVEQAASTPAPDATGKHEKALHQFLAAGQNAIAVRMVIGLLQRCAAEDPALSRPNALMAAMEPDANNEISLTVDLSDGFASSSAGKAAHATVEAIGQLVQQLGMAYAFQGDGVSQVFNGQGGIASMISVGADLEDDDEFSAMFGGARVKLPKNAVAVRTMEVRHADILEDVTLMDADAVERLELERFVARTNFDMATLSLIPEDIVLSPEKIKQSNGLIQAIAPLEDAARPGARRARFMEMPMEMQTEILNSFGGVGRYVFAQELSLPQDHGQASLSRPRP